MRKFIPLISMLVVLGILGLSVIYLSHRMNFFLESESSAWYYIFSGALVFMIVGLAGFTNSNSFTGSIVYQSAALLMGFLLYYILSVLAVHLASVFINFSPQTSGYISIGLTILIFSYGIWNSFNTRITRMELDMPGLDKPVRIAHLTDIHIGHFRTEKTLKKIVDKTNSENPDIVVITGDLFDGSIRVNGIASAPLKEFDVPVLFVNGNHDGYSGLKSVFNTMVESGVMILQNEVTEINGIQFIGLNHMNADSSTPGMHTGAGPTIKDVLEKIKVSREKPAVLLHHSPDGVEYAQKAGADLYLAGHTHGGQTFPITLLNNLIFKYNKGLYDFKGMKIFVSKGIGTFGPPMRVGSKSEIVILDLN